MITRCARWFFLIEYIVFMIECSALLMEYRALLIEYIVFMIECSALLMEYRALLIDCTDTDTDSDMYKDPTQN